MRRCQVALMGDCKDKGALEIRPPTSLDRLIKNPKKSTRH
ncbi:unnamed protein product [Acidithrix sp. C25]|nr:unnamed protein product [Acidithrix sp. C25]